jgi:hypothetical protein
MVTVSGELQVGEARGTAQAIAVRQRGPIAIFYCALAALMALGGVLGYGLGLVIEAEMGRPDIPPPLFGTVGIWIGWVLYMLLGRRLLAYRFKQSMRDRGLDLRIPYTLTVSDDGLSLESQRMRRSAQWSVVTEVFRSRGYWIFMVQTEPWFAPSRFFREASDEKAFLREALSRMSVEAQRRSKKAVEFASA